MPILKLFRMLGSGSMVIDPVVAPRCISIPVSTSRSVSAGLVL